MFTTAGFSRSTTSAKFTSDAIPVPTPLWAGGTRPAAALAGAPAETADRATPPAMIAPTMKATPAVSVTVTSVKRPDISESIINTQERQKLGLIHPLHAQPL